MNADQLLDACDRVLSRLGNDAEAEVTVASGTDALTRFATSFIHQNVADAVRRIHLRVALDGHVAESFANQTDDDALDRLVRSATDAARLRPPDPGWPGLAPPSPAAPVEHWDDATAAASARPRA
jgi:predicted Zn-dependent protease